MSSQLSVVETTNYSQIAALEEAIPEFSSKQSLWDLEVRLNNRVHLALVALWDGTPVGYKVGYRETARRFYSWIGAVLPDYRGRGIARALLHYQEQWVREKGFREITVWSENRYRGMLIFLLKERYDVFAVTGEGAVMMRKLIPASGSAKPNRRG